MRALAPVLLILLSACEPPSTALRTGRYAFQSVRGREVTPSAAVASSALEIDIGTREVKLTLQGATRRFTLSPRATVTSGCAGNFSSTAQETRTLDAPNLQLGEFLIDEPLLRSDCPPTVTSLVLQSGPLLATGAAPECSAEVVCLVYARP